MTFKIYRKEEKTKKRPRRTKLQMERARMAQRDRAAKRAYIKSIKERRGHPRIDLLTSLADGYSGGVNPYDSRTPGYCAFELGRIAREKELGKPVNIRRFDYHYLSTWILTTGERRPYRVYKALFRWSKGSNKSVVSIKKSPTGPTTQ